MIPDLLPEKLRINVRWADSAEDLVDDIDDADLVAYEGRRAAIEAFLALVDVNHVDLARALQTESRHREGRE